MPAATKAPGKQANTDLNRVFDEVAALLRKYVPPFEARSDPKGGYHLWSAKPVVIGGRKKQEVYFAGVIPQKGYVGLYYMPVYTNPERKALFAPELLSLLKGKSCFHLRALDSALQKQVREALESGYRMYKQRGWV